MVISVHSQFKLSEADQTKRMIKAVSNPYARILGHPTGRLLLSRDPYAVNLRAVLEAAAAHQVAVEINASPYRLDLDWRECRAGARLQVLHQPRRAHRRGADDERFGIGVARKGWLTAADVINTWSRPSSGRSSRGQRQNRRRDRTPPRPAPPRRKPAAGRERRPRPPLFGNERVEQRFARGRTALRGAGPRSGANRPLCTPQAAVRPGIAPAAEIQMRISGAARLLQKPPV